MRAPAVVAMLGLASAAAADDRPTHWRVDRAHHQVVTTRQTSDDCNTITCTMPAKALADGGGVAGEISDESCSVTGRVCSTHEFVGVLADGGSGEIFTERTVDSIGESRACSGCSCDVCAVHPYFWLDGNTMAKFRASEKDGAVEVVGWHLGKIVAEEVVTPNEARELAAELLREADKASGGPPCVFCGVQHPPGLSGDACPT